MLKTFLLGLLLASAPTVSLAQSVPGDIPFNGRDYIQHRYDSSLHKGAAVDQDGCVNHLQGVPASIRPLVKTTWVTFDNSANGGLQQWIEHGCTKSWTASTIAVPAGSSSANPSYYEGHYFAFQTVRNLAPVGSSPNLELHYYEGRVGQANGVPSGTHRYKIERDDAQNSRWCGYVNNAANYCVTLNGVGIGAINNYQPYNFARWITIGIESGNINQTFGAVTSSGNNKTTTARNAWFKSGSANVWARIPGLVDADNAPNRPTWNSTYSPYVSGTSPDTITFTR